MNTIVKLSDSTRRTILLLIIGICFIQITFCAPLDDFESNGRSGHRVLVEVDNPRQVVKALESLLLNFGDSQSTYILNDKRGLDLGLSRGFSGRQAAKHLVGLASAQFANGPGKKR